MQLDMLLKKVIVSEKANLKLDKNISVLQNSLVPFSYCSGMFPELRSTVLKLIVPVPNNLQLRELCEFI
jgi:hypothetical protein